MLHAWCTFMCKTSREQLKKHKLHTFYIEWSATHTCCILRIIVFVQSVATAIKNYFITRLLYNLTSETLKNLRRGFYYRIHLKILQNWLNFHLYQRLCIDISSLTIKRVYIFRKCDNVEDCLVQLETHLQHKTSIQISFLN